MGHDIFHQWVGVLNNFIRLITGALSSGIKTNDDRDIIEDLRGHALSKFIVDDEHIDSAFLDGTRKLFLGGTDVEQIDRGAGVAFRCHGSYDAAAVASHNSQADFIQAQR